MSKGIIYVVDDYPVTERAIDVQIVGLGLAIVKHIAKVHNG